MDFENLLSKYMNNVSRQEGIFFIPFVPNEEFSREEIDCLEKIASNILASDASDPIWARDGLKNSAWDALGKREPPQSDLSDK